MHFSLHQNQNKNDFTFNVYNLLAPYFIFWYISLYPKTQNPYKVGFNSLMDMQDLDIEPLVTNYKMNPLMKS